MRQVERAIEHAVIVHDSSEITNDLSAYTHQGDDFPFAFGDSTVPPDQNEAVVPINGPIGLLHLFHAYGEVTGRTLNRGYCELNDRHEQQHFEAAKYLGATNARLGVRFFKTWLPDGRENLLTQPFLSILDFTTTKLGAALITAYPFVVSKGDHEDIAGFGYDCIEDLAWRAMAKNRLRRNLNDVLHPVPLSFSERTAPRLIGRGSYSLTGTPYQSHIV